jgi:hypothetical protein
VRLIEEALAQVERMQSAFRVLGKGNLRRIHVMPEEGRHAEQLGLRGQVIPVAECGQANP